MLPFFNDGCNDDHRQWYLPPDAIMRLGKGQIGDIAFSPDGKKLAVASSIGIWIYNANTYKEFALLTGNWEKLPSRTYIKVKYSPDGRILASINNNYEIHFWNTYTGNLMAKTRRNQYGINDIVFSPYGKTLVSSGNDATIRFWDSQTGNLKGVISEQRGVQALGISPDGKIIASSGGEDNAIRLWDFKTRQNVATLTGATQNIHSLAFSPNGVLLVSGGGDSSIMLWQPKTGKHIHTLTRHTGNVDRLAFSADGKTLISGSSDGTIQLWNAQTWQHRKTFNPGYKHLSFALSPNDDTLANAYENGTIQFYDVKTGHHKATITGYMPGKISTAFYPQNSFTFSPDDKKLLTSSGHLWDVETGQQHVLTEGLKNHNPIVFSPDGKFIASGNKAGGIFIWYANSGVPRTILAGHSDEIACLVFSPNGKYLASGCADYSEHTNKSNDTSIRLWNVQTGRQKTILTGHTGGVACIAFSPDGQMIASGSEDNTIRLWDTNTGQHIKTLEGHTGGVACVVFSPDGKMLASGSRNSENREDKKTDYTIRLWDVNTGNQKYILSGHTGRILSVVFSPDGQTLKSGSQDGSIRVWDTLKGKHIHSLWGYFKFQSVAFSTDVRLAATYSRNGTILLWDISKK